MNMFEQKQIVGWKQLFNCQSRTASGHGKHVGETVGVVGRDNLGRAGNFRVAADRI